MASAMPPAPTTQEQDDKKEKTDKKIAAILSHAGPLAGTDGETYLASRSITLPATPDLRFHLDFPGESGERFSVYAASTSKRHGLL